MDSCLIDEPKCLTIGLLLFLLIGIVRYDRIRYEPVFLELLTIYGHAIYGHIRGIRVYYHISSDNFSLAHTLLLLLHN